ncbi:MAG: hypothetical protein ACI9QC_000358 [Oceanicoccus sp.]|jgi:hypothetical protein
MENFIPKTMLAAALMVGGSAQAADNSIEYTPAELSSMCDPEGRIGGIANYANIAGATTDVNSALAEALRDPSKAELATVLSNELLDALYGQLHGANADPAAVLNVLGDIQLGLDQLMTGVDYNDDSKVSEAIDKIGAYMKGLNNLSILLSSLANDRGNALNRRQLLERYEASLDTVALAWQVDNGLTALELLNTPTAWDCSPIVLAYGVTGSWPTSLEVIESLESTDTLAWSTPDVSVLTGPEYSVLFDYEQDETTDRRSRLALSNAYEQASAAVAEVVDELKPLVDEFEKRQGIEDFSKDPEPAVNMVWGTPEVLEEGAE